MSLYMKGMVKYMEGEEFCFVIDKLLWSSLQNNDCTPWRAIFYMCHTGKD